MGIMNMGMRLGKAYYENFGYRFVFAPGFHYISII